MPLPLPLRLALIAIPCLGLALPAAAQTDTGTRYGNYESGGYHLPMRIQQEPPPPGWEQATPNTNMPQTPGGIASARNAPMPSSDPASSFLGGVPGAPLGGLASAPRASIFGNGSSFSGALTAPRPGDNAWSPALGDEPLGNNGR